MNMCNQPTSLADHQSIRRLVQWVLVLRSEFATRRSLEHRQQKLMDLCMIPRRGRFHQPGSVLGFQQAISIDHPQITNADAADRLIARGHPVFFGGTPPGIFFTIAPIEPVVSVDLGQPHVRGMRGRRTRCWRVCCRYGARRRQHLRWGCGVHRAIPFPKRKRRSIGDTCSFCSNRKLRHMDRKGPVPAGQKTSVGALELRACVVTPRPVVTVSASGNTQGFSHTRRVFSLQVVTTAVAIGRSVLATPDGVACCFMAFQYDNFVPLARLLDNTDCRCAAAVAPVIAV